MFPPLERYCNLKLQYLKIILSQGSKIKGSDNEKIKKNVLKYRMKRFKFPIDLIEFPIKYSSNPKVLKGKEKSLEFYLEGRYGPYYIDAPRKYKLMDIRTLLATLYFTDYHKEISFKEKFTNWLNLLEVPDT